MSISLSATPLYSNGCLKSAYVLNSHPCPGCGSINPDEKLIFSRCPDYSLHYASYHCPECGCFMRWAEKPKNVQRRADRQKAIAQLLKCELGGWQRHFLKDIYSLKKLSPKQGEKLQELLSKHSGEVAINGN